VSFHDIVNMKLEGEHVLIMVRLGKRLGYILPRGSVHYVVVIHTHLAQISNTN
jgi:hypothetical protein